MVTANLSIMSLNLSLMLNTVGFYQVCAARSMAAKQPAAAQRQRCRLQIAKLLIIPFVCLVEKFWLGRRFTPSVVTAITIVVIGVAIVYVPCCCIPAWHREAC